MSETTRIGVNITANNRVEPTLAALQRQIEILQRSSVNMSDVSRASVERHIATIQQEISARRAEIGAIGEVGAAEGRLAGSQSSAATAQLNRIKAVADAQMAAASSANGSSSSSSNAQLNNIRSVANAQMEATNRSAAAEEAARARSMSSNSAAAASQLTSIRGVANAQLDASARSSGAAASAAASQLASIKAVANAQMTTGSGINSGALAASQLNSIKAVADAQLAASTTVNSAQASSAAAQLTSIRSIATAQMEASNKSVASSASAAASQLNSIRAVASASVTEANRTAAAVDAARNRSIAASASAAASQLNNIRAVANAQMEASAREEAAVERVRMAHMSAAASQLTAIKAVADAQMASALRLAAVGTAATTAGAGVGILQKELRSIVAGFDELQRGQRGQFFSTLGAAARNAGLGVAGMSGAIVGLVAVMSTLTVLRKAEDMAKWATELRASASAAGMSVQAYSALQGALTAMGLKANEADESLRRLASNMSTALEQATSKQAEAFHNLGISQETLIRNGTSVAGMLRLLADAFVHTEDGANKTANMEEILGRGFEKLIPLLQNGGRGLDEFTAKARENGKVISEEQAKALEELGGKVRAVGEAITSGAIPAFLAWKEPIESIANSLKGLIGIIGQVLGGLGQVATAGLKAERSAEGVIDKYVSKPIADTIISGMRWLNTTDAVEPRGGKFGPPRPPSDGSYDGEFGRTPRSAGSPSGRVAVPPLTAPVTTSDSMRRDMAQAEEAAARSATNVRAARIAETEAGIAVLRKYVAASKEGSEERVRFETQLAEKLKTLHNEQLSSGGSAAKQATRDFIAEGKLQIAEADGNAKKIAEIYDTMLAGLVSSHTATAAQIAQIEREKVMAVNRARLEEIREGGRQEMQESKLHRLDTELGQIATGQMKFAGQGQQGPDMDLARSKSAVQEAEMTRNRAEMEISALREIAMAAEEGSKTRRQAEQEILTVTVAAKTQEVALYKEAGAAAVAAQQKLMAPFTHLFDSVGNRLQSFSDSVFEALIAPQQEFVKRGLTTVKLSGQTDQLRNAAGALLKGIVSDLGHSLTEALGHVVANILSKGAANTIGELLSQTLSKAVGSIFGSAAGSALGNVAGSAAGGGVTAAAIATAAATTVTGIDAGLVSLGATLATEQALNAGLVVGAIESTGAVTAALLASISVQQPSVAGFSLSGGGIIPSAAGGMTVGGNGATLAVLHAKEMVLPAPISQGIQQMIAHGSPGGNGPNNNASLNYSPTINNNGRGRGGTGMTRGEFGQMMASHSGAMFGEARNMMKQGWRPG